MSQQPDRCAKCGNATVGMVRFDGKNYCPKPCYDAVFREAEEARQVGRRGEFQDVADRMLALSRQRREEIEKFAEGKPLTVKCDRHDYLRKIDWDRSVVVSRERSEQTLVYTDCPTCADHRRIANASAWLHNAGVPKLICHATFENFITRGDADRMNLDVARKFAKRRAGFLTLIGDVGTGKSHLAAAILREVGGGWFVTQAALISGLRRKYDDRKADDVKLKATRARLLVLDEIGLSAEGSDVFPTLHEILDCRHGEKMPTVMTSSPPGPATVADLKQFVGPRLADRLRQSSYKILHFAGESLRGTMTQEYFEQ